MKELSTKYDHRQVEKDKYEFWLKNEFFKSGDLTKEPFTIVVPPPNVTGRLHLGHAWDTTIQDIIIRRKRMQGFDALFLPGMDHAGIATQAKVDEKLKLQGVSRYDLGREEFLKVAWEWKVEYADFIRSQWAKLGISFDYSKERFTLDEGLNNAVNKVFVDYYNKGFIYQGTRIINWDPDAKTALSNIEVEYKETLGAFYHIRYDFEKEEGGLVIATTRPETLFADVALMVNPNDEINSKHIGKMVKVPTTNRYIPVVADEHVEIGVGTGIVKVTPAHDPNDYEVGLRHNLEMPLCMNEDGTMNSMAGVYEGLDRFDCRKKLIEDLKNESICTKVEEINHNVGYSERTGAMVEPRLSTQWFVKMEELAKDALEFQKTNAKVDFVPSRFEKIFDNWMNDIHDWCISRQLWWGHRIPAWYKDNEIKVQVESPGDDWRQDEDVLDTWFSSALWPFSTLGWPEESDDFNRYFPTNVLVTGYDIIFFWVSRMMFQSVELTGKAPFNDCLIHGLIRAEDGQKMSKSLGNGIDPMDVIDEYGCDSLRYYLTTNSSPGLDLRFNYEKLSSSWNFINKIWNISRYIFMNVEEYKEVNFDNVDTLSKWILSELSDTITQADRYYEKYEFGEAAKAIYNFTWDTFASWYVEMSKVSLNNPETKSETANVLVYVLDSIIKLLHPFMPFVTEEIYSLSPLKTKESITIDAWPTAKFKDDLSQSKVNVLIDVITSVRNIRASKNVKPSKKLDITLLCDNDNTKVELQSLNSYLEKFTNSEKLNITTSYNIKTDEVTQVLSNVTVAIPLAGLVDLEEEKEKLNNELKKLESEIKRAESMLSNENFVSKAPAQKIEEEKNKLADYKNKYNSVKENLEKLS